MIAKPLFQVENDTPRIPIDTVINGEALETLKTLPNACIDAVVCDPPAGIAFMNKSWDSFSGYQRNWDSQSEREAAKAKSGKTQPFACSHGKGTTTAKERNNFIAFMTNIMQECLRILKPGGHALVWSLPRTSHWTALALEYAGFTIRDCIYNLVSGDTALLNFLASLNEEQQQAFMNIIDNQRENSSILNIFGSGFPKSLNLSKCIEGFGTALKPAVENWWLVRKPLATASITENVLQYGTGGINIDATRISHNEQCKTMKAQDTIKSMYQQSGRYEETLELKLSGRFPSHLLLSHTLFCQQTGIKKVPANGPPPDVTAYYGNDIFNSGIGHNSSISYREDDGMETVIEWVCDENCPVRLLDLQGGLRKSGGHKPHEYHNTSNIYGSGKGTQFKSGMITSPPREASEGYVSRYFQQFPAIDEAPPFIYAGKASREDRNSGCEALPEKQGFDKNTSKSIIHSNPDTGEIKHFEYHPSSNKNTHPTVKSQQLMRYLVRLVTPKNGVVLDCFAGSGSTLTAAIREGFHFIGIECEKEYVDIANARIAQAYKEVHW